MKNCYIYVRVSTDEQAKEGYSLENQKRICIEYAQLQGYHVKKVFIEDGKSGTNIEGRPAFKEMFNLLPESLVEAVIILKIDRIARNVGDFSDIRKQFKKLGIKLLSITENGDVTEGLVGNIFAAVAEWESEVNGDRTRNALMQKFREGWQPSPPPHGYRSVGGERERKTCEPNSYTAPIIIEFFELFATGNYSILAITDWLSDKNIISKNGTPLGHSVVWYILTNPFYYGLIRWNGESKIGKHIPLISKDLFETCQYVLAKHKTFNSRRGIYNFLLRGFIYCAECGQRYTAEWHKNEVKLRKRGGKIAYYHCKKLGRNGCPAPYVEITELEKQVEEEIKNMQFSDEFIEIVVKKTREKLATSREEVDSIVQGLINQKTAFETKRNKLEDALIDGIIDRDTFKRKHSELETKISSVQVQIQTIESRSKIDIDLIDEILAFTRNIHQTYKNAPDFLKRHYLRFFYEKIVVKNKEILEIIPTPIFLSLHANRAVIITNSGSATRIRT